MKKKQLNFNSLCSSARVRDLLIFSCYFYVDVLMPYSYSRFLQEEGRTYYIDKSFFNV